eukprot:GHVT01062269.1.p1 GENE.GHVT01062269.1~~GHVT01062269.1.p1  ORF type:complete len:124 (-),score=3.74 GHVT01062269.1:290-640(-)
MGRVYSALYSPLQRQCQFRVSGCIYLVLFWPDCAFSSLFLAVSQLALLGRSRNPLFAVLKLSNDRLSALSTRFDKRAYMPLSFSSRLTSDRNIGACRRLFGVDLPLLLGRCFVTGA